MCACLIAYLVVCLVGWLMRWLIVLFCVRARLLVCVSDCGFVRLCVSLLLRWFVGLCAWLFVWMCPCLFACVALFVHLFV